MAATANNRDGISKYTECVRCGTVFSFTTKPEKNANAGDRPSDAAFDLDRRTQLDKGPPPVACPTCHYLPPAQLMRGKMSSTVGFVFLIAFPAVALMVVKGIAVQPDLDLPQTLMTGLAILFEAMMVGLGALAAVSLLFYHPARSPFSKWSAQGTLLREGRPRAGWGIAPPPDEPAAASTNADDIDPSKITLPPEDPEEDDGFSTMPAPAPARTEPVRAVVAPAAVSAREHAAVSANSAASHAPVQTVVATAPARPPECTPAAPAAAQPASSGHSVVDHAHDHAAAPDQVILECPQCHKKFRAPGSVLSKMPKCKYCHVELEDTLDI